VGGGLWLPMCIIVFGEKAKVGNRDWIMIEQEEEYYKLSLKRVADFNKNI